ncbi:MAG: hypothetical protein KC910_15105 [Candidatus Eremiobacteraeota bacterium]|nr:hypothetical protein [Candidatus Eremiobacteraeota bacterium]
MKQPFELIPDWCRSTVEDFFDNGHLTEKDESQKLTGEQARETLQQVCEQFEQLQALDETERDLMPGEEGALAVEFGGMRVEAFFEGDVQNGWVLFTVGKGKTATVALTRFAPELVDLITLNAGEEALPHARAVRVHRQYEGSYAELRGQVVDPWVALTL